MTDLAALAPDPSAATAPTRHTPAQRGTILFYAGVITVALMFTSPAVGAFVIPLSFLLKNKLHLSANGLATFSLWASVPGYFCFLFGVVRDFWSPLGMGDRGYFVLFGAATAALFASFAFVPVSVSMLFVCAVMIAIAYLFMWGAWNGLGSTIGRQHAMTGQMSAIWNFAGTAAMVAALALGGVLSDRLEAESVAGAVRTLFLFAAVVMAAIAALGVWKPDAVFSGLRDERDERRNPAADLLRLAGHRPIYPALLIWLLWNFSPASQTALQYYMSDALHASDAQWGAYNAIASGAAIPAFVLFGFLSRWLSLRALMWAGAMIAVPQMVPLLFAHSASGVIISAIPTGLMGGIATAAFFDLLIRSCPDGLEGSLMMLAWSMYALSTNFGNLWGTDLYEHHGGFIVCVAATTFVYALILPTILFVPRKLIATTDEEVAAG